MSKSYDFSKKSDMKKFQKDLVKSIEAQVSKAIGENEVEINCPHCDKKINVHAGNNVCPYCSNNISVNFEFNG